jgi:spore coat protein B
MVLSTSYRKQESFNPQFHHDFLNSLIGKEVQVYRKGPDSKIGKLLAAHSDYITLYVQKPKSIVYYNVQHIKSITENVKANAHSYYEQQEDAISCVQADDFRGLLKQLINENVHVNQGPDSRPGRLVAAVEDYIILFTKDDGYVFFNTAHIKSITVNSEKKIAMEKETAMEGNMQLDYVAASSFHDVFRHMNHKWVSINGKGPEAIEGVLSEGTGGHYTLVNNEEVLRIYPYHIKSISSGPKGSFKKVMENIEKNNQNQSEEDNSTSEDSQNETSDQGSNQDNNQASNQSSNQDSNKDSDKDSSKDSSSDKGSNENSNKYSNQYSNKNNNKYSDKYSSNSNSRGYSRETVIESIDYDWNPKGRY